jgi:hypothetical protein
MRKMPGKIAVALCAGGLSVGCASGGPPRGGAGLESGYLTLRTEGGTWQMRIEPSGRVFGADFELQATDTGYRGVASGAIATMDSTDGSRVVGTRDGRPIDLRVSEEGGTILATGLYAGLMGRLELGAQAIRSSMGRCNVQLTLETERRYTGHRICRGSAHFRPVVIELPEVWMELSTPRKVMLFATLVGA